MTESVSFVRDGQSCLLFADSLIESCSLAADMVVSRLPLSLDLVLDMVSTRENPSHQKQWRAVWKDH